MELHVPWQGTQCPLQPVHRAGLSVPGGEGLTMGARLGTHGSSPPGPASQPPGPGREVGSELRMTQSWTVRQQVRAADGGGGRESGPSVGERAASPRRGLFTRLAPRSCPGGSVCSRQSWASCHYDSQDQVDTLTFQSQSLRDRARRFEEALRRSTEEQLEVGKPAWGRGAHQEALLNFSPGAHVASSAGSPKAGPLC